MSETPENTPQQPDETGGMGEVRRDDGQRSHGLHEPGSPAELKLERRAIRQRWKMTDEQRSKLVEKNVSLALTSKDERIAVSATRNLVAMESQNQSDDQERNKYDRLDKGKNVDQPIKAYYCVDEDKV